MYKLIQQIMVAHDSSINVTGTLDKYIRLHRDEYQIARDRLHRIGTLLKGNLFGNIGNKKRKKMTDRFSKINSQSVIFGFPFPLCLQIFLPRFGIREFHPGIGFSYFWRLEGG